MYGGFSLFSIVDGLYVCLKSFSCVGSGFCYVFRGGGSYHVSSFFVFCFLLHFPLRSLFKWVLRSLGRLVSLCSLVGCMHYDSFLSRRVFLCVSWVSFLGRLLLSPSSNLSIPSCSGLSGFSCQMVFICQLSEVNWVYP